jgi:hypothetical protein
MLKTLSICLLIALGLITLAGCSLITGEGISEPAGKEIPVGTEFGRMLGYVPSSLIEEHDVWFGNMLKAKEISGLEDLNTYEGAEETIREMPEEKGRQFVNDWGTASSLYTYWNRPEIKPFVGFDAFSFDHILVINSVPPRISCIAEGNIDEALIIGKLTELGYTRTDYGQYSYYGIHGDYEIDMINPLSQLVLAAMNRMAVFDDTVIMSPVTDNVTRIFDTMAGDVPSVIDNSLCRALADSLGDVLVATLTTPERVVYSDIYTQEEVPKFDFTPPADWGTLHGYEMAAIGYKAEGEKRVLMIALCYADEAVARADGATILKRMASYTLRSWLPQMENIPFTEKFQVGEPVIKQCGDGVVLTIDCQLSPEDWRGASMEIGSSGMIIRDLLFLAPDPAPYIGKNEGPEIIVKEK